MRTNIKLASAVLALSLMAAALVAPSTAQEEDEITILDLSLGFAYDEDFQGGDGGWGTTEIPPWPDAERPDPVNPSWEHGEIPAAPSRPAPTNPQWERGEPTNGPGAGAWGNVFGVNLHANYATPHCAAIISPPVDLSGAASATMSFEHWIHSDASTTTAWHMGLVFVTTDGGATLTRIVPDGGYPSPNGGATARTCLDGQPTGTNGYAGAASASFSTQTFTLNPAGLANPANVQFVFGFGTDSAGNGNFAGWFIDDVVVTADGTPVFVEDFEADDGGFTVTGTALPAGILPPGAHSGSNAWATFLGGALNVIECSGIMSPPIDLSGATSASVAFHHWYHMRELSTSAPHAGLVFATTDGGKTLQKITPDGGYFSKPITVSTALNCLDGQSSGTTGVGGGPPAGWQEISFDLDAFVGADELQIVLGFRKGDTVASFSGWYMDSFATTIDGVTTVEDFESGEGGFSVVSVEVPDFPPFPKGWEWGEPTTGPGVENNTRLWATQLHGDHGHYECSWIESPPFQVGPIPNALNSIVDARLSWQHWFRSNSIYGSGVVQIGVDGEYHILEPEGGYPASIGSTSATFAEVTEWQTDCFGMDWQPGDPLERGYSGTTASTGGHAVGDPLSDHRADLSAYAGKDITIRYLFATGWRDANPATHPGWYVDNIEVEVRVVVTAPSPESLLGGATTNAPGWSSGGPEGENQWEWGFLDGGFEYATNLLGPYSIPHCGYIESPVVSGSVIAADPTLAIDHRYSMSQSGSFAWYAGLVLASADGGPWQLVDFDDQLYSASTPSRTCVNTLTGTQPPTGTPAFGAWETEWHTSTTDLSEFADADEVQFRFVMGGTSTSNTGCDEVANPCNGWSIRGVEVGGQELLALPSSLLPSLPV